MHQRLTTRTVAAVAAMLALGSLVPARGSNIVTFTWDPSQAIPSLVAGPAAFTADGIQGQNFLNVLNVNNLATLKQSSEGDQLQPITGFTLHGSPVIAPGLNVSYGLYFSIHQAGVFPINASGATVGPPVYTVLNLSLVADVGHDNGTAFVNNTQVGFSNPAGTANDVVLATGHLITASLSRTPDGVRHAHYLTTFQPVAGEEGLFTNSPASLAWEAFLSTPDAAFSVIPVDSLSVRNRIDGAAGSAVAAQLVPEPASAALLLAGLLGAAWGCRWRGSRMGG